MQILEPITIFSQAVFRYLGSTADTCNLFDYLPEPLDSIEGECVRVSDCHANFGYATVGFCRGAAEIQCCTTSFAYDNGMADTPNGELSDFGRDLIESLEGFVDNFYCDANSQATYGHRHCLPGEGTLTIGFGHACQPESACDFITSLPISRSFGEQLMVGDVNRMQVALNNALDDTVEITQNQHDALISYIFNVGPGRVGPPAVAINAGDFATAENIIRTGIGDKKRRSIEANVFISC